MKELVLAARTLQSFLESKNWDFCYIGGIAVQRWGENRVTRDLDLTILTRFENDERYLTELLTVLKPRRNDAYEFALAHRVLLAEADDGTPVDIALGGLPFEINMINSSSDFEFLPGVSLRSCSAESLVVMKAFADRPRDWEDVRGILVRQGNKIDREEILRELTPLAELKEQPEILARLKDLFDQAAVT